MTIKTISDSERDPSKPSGDAQSSTQAAVDRLAGRLPPEALEDALRGLEPEEITGPGGLLNQLAGRVIETALGAELTGHLGHPPAACRPVRTCATGRRPRRCRRISGRSRSARHATATAASIRSWSRSARRAWRAWTRRSSRSTPAG